MNPARIGLSILLSVTAFFASSCKNAQPVADVKNIDSYMASLAAQAVDRANSSYGITLDYSPDSVKEVEKLLGVKYDMAKTQPMSEDEMSDAAHLWGSYVGEVMKRLHPAHWERDSAAGGKDALPIVFNDTREQSFPCAWVYHRLKNGDEDNVWFKFHVVTQPGGLKQYFPPKKEITPAPQSKSTP
jgi:hypothetical protein